MCDLWNSSGVLFPDETSLVNFVGYLAKVRRLSYSTIKLYLCGVRHAFVSSHGRNPLVDPMGNPLLRLEMTIRGVKKSTPPAPDNRLPITIDILQSFIQRINCGLLGNYEDKLMAAVTSLAFWGFLRCAEFTGNTRFDPSCNLNVDDITWLGVSGFQLLLRSSKTDPFRSGISLFYSALGNIICPVIHFKRYLDIRPSGGLGSLQSALFILDGEALTRNKFINLLRLTRLQ